MTSSLRRTLHSLSDRRRPGQPRLSWTAKNVISEDLQELYLYLLWFEALPEVLHHHGKFTSVDEPIAVLCRGAV